MSYPRRQRSFWARIKLSVKNDSVPVRETESLRSDFHCLKAKPSGFVRSKSFNFKKDRQITHNSMFAVYYHCEFRLKRNIQPDFQRTAILSGTRQYPTLSLPDQNRLVSSQEKNTKSHAETGPLPRDSQNSRSRHPVKRNSQTFSKFLWVTQSIHIYGPVSMQRQ